MSTNASRLPRSLSVELHVRQTGLDVQAQLRALPGRVNALVGRVENGQRAVLEAAAGLRPAISGRVALGADALYDARRGVNLPPHQRRLGWLDADLHLFPHLTVGGNLAYGARAQGARMHIAPGMDTASLVKWLDLSAMLDRRPHELKPAQRLRAALARALAADPQGLLMADPLGRVSEPERPELIEILAQVAHRFQLPVLMTTPRMDEVVRMADDVVILHDGRMAGAGPITQLLSDVSLSTFLEGVHAGSILEGAVTRHDIEWVISEVDICGQCVSVPATAYPVGTRVRMKIRARDINLHREVPADTSSTNVLRGRIAHVMLAGQHGTYGAVGVELARELDERLELKAGAQVWGLVTRQAIQQMNWQPGEPCVVGFNAMAAQVTPLPWTAPKRG
jgi:molybdate transport system ATP-binding protein